MLLQVSSLLVLLQQAFSLSFSSYSSSVWYFLSARIKDVRGLMKNYITIAKVKEKKYFMSEVCVYFLGIYSIKFENLSIPLLLLSLRISQNLFYC